MTFSWATISEYKNAIGYHFRVLDEIGGVADRTGRSGSCRRRSFTSRTWVHDADGRCWRRSSVAVFKLRFLTASCHLLGDSNLLGGHFCRNSISILCRRTSRIAGRCCGSELNHICARTKSCSTPRSLVYIIPRLTCADSFLCAAVGVNATLATCLRVWDFFFLIHG
jgi:hypothetical protein